MNWIRRLGLYWGLHPEIVDDVDYEGWVITSPLDDRLPDTCVYLVTSKGITEVPQRVPDLIFEFVSGNRVDQERAYIFKRAEYHAIGVKEFVIVDLFKSEALVLTWKPGDYLERRLSPRQKHKTKLLPGLAIALKEGFAPK